MFKIGLNMKENLEVDEHQTYFENIYIYVTNRCNMFCKHCYLGNRLIKREEMSKQDVYDHLLFWKNLGSKKICFLGGEPTLYPHLKECVEYAHKLNYDKILINSNLSNQAFEVINKLGINSFTYIQTSLDGATNGTHDSIRGEGAFDKTVKNILKLTKQGYDIRIIMTVNVLNLSEMIPMIELAEQLGCSLVKFHIMSEIGNAEKNLNLGLSPATWYNACEKLKQYAKNGSNRKIKISYQPTYSSTEYHDEYIHNGYRGCVGKYKERISIFPDGKCYICSFLFDRDDSYAILHNGTVDLNLDSIELNFSNHNCNGCNRCSFDGCIAEEAIYHSKICDSKDEYSLYPVCRLWKIEL